MDQMRAAQQRMNDLLGREIRDEWGGVQGHELSQDEKMRLEVKRIGNICLQAKDEGWVASATATGGNYRVSFAKGERVVSETGDSLKLALAKAAITLGKQLER